ncbi:MAG TPA: DPP IV N-terminal domain-containing protein [Isosphaeraceae bacterium]|jgi:dipeptidyl aminopeptidase/acylaminoacyl peptidase|nr:DPP IV N-terminal domain-containing protein [Isosphaeraceae bacterium]
MNERVSEKTIRRVVSLVVLAALVGWPQPGWAQGTKADYARAEGLREKTREKVFKSRVSPHWFAQNERFWYRNDLAGGSREFVVADATTGRRGPAFDHGKLAEALTKATTEPHEATRLPIERIEFSDDGAIRFNAHEKGWRYEPKTNELTEGPKLEGSSEPERRSAFGPGGGSGGGERRRASSPRSETSPDGEWTVSIKDHNVHLRGKDSSTSNQLTYDGIPSNSYEERAFWSPDSKELVILRTEKGDEHLVYLIESSPKDQLQPKLHSFPYLKPGDKMPITKPHLFDVASHTEIPLDDELFSNPWSISEVHWASDSRMFTFLYNQRGHQVLRIVGIDAQTGVARPVIDERSKTFVEYSGKYFLHHVDDTGEIIWMSERDGWNHLYLFNGRTGQLKNQITKGEWVVRNVDRVDEKERTIWFRAGGIDPAQDPYYIHFGRVNFDGTGLVDLTPGNGTHEVEFSPDRRFLIDSYSRIDRPPVTDLRRCDDGKFVCELEQADWSALLETGWQMPERFVAKGRDGQTDIYGVIFRPMNLDPNKKYPVIEEIYAGPQGSFVPKRFAPFYGHQALAELGFVVVQIDGMGTSNRSKAFHDVCWKNLGDAGFPDRILWLKAAVEKYPYMDLTRIGIHGGSAGGQNALGGLLFHGDFYKVGVADCGCHDNRMDKVWWNELWMGWPIGPHYAEQSNTTNAHKLQGKLMLLVGELDRNVDPASTMQVVNALIQADKDFDLLVVPGAGHGGGGRYGERRRRDFFVRHLLGGEPRTQ